MKPAAKRIVTIIKQALLVSALVAGVLLIGLALAHLISWVWAAALVFTEASFGSPWIYPWGGKTTNADIFTA